MTWASPPAHHPALVEHLRTAFEPLVNAVAGWQHEAASIEAQQEAAWQRLAVAIGAWLERYQQALADDQLRGRLESARKTLLDVEKILRKERMAPIMDHARRIWSLLRQESSVDLGDIDLIGQSVRRGVEISASVDGAEAGALSVMSQGELHALALAIFLPRAALAESPFRFIILDDPVQAMDPAKVDGLARVLADLALTRQVIVPSHDDRLAQAARRLPTPPRILEVTRDPGSRVRVHESHSPTRRYLADADALRKDPDLPEATCREIIPGVLRQALEAACYEKYYSDRLQAGATLGEAEAAWSAAMTTKQRVQLLLGPRTLDGWRMRVADAVALWKSAAAGSTVRCVEISTRRSAMSAERFVIFKVGPRERGRCRPGHSVPPHRRGSPHRQNADSASAVGARCLLGRAPGSGRDGPAATAASRHRRRTREHERTANLPASRVRGRSCAVQRPRQRMGPTIACLPSPRI